MGFRGLLRFRLRETADGSFLELTSRFSYVALLKQVGLSAGCVVKDLTLNPNLHDGSDRAAGSARNRVQSRLENQRKPKSGF